MVGTWLWAECALRPCLGTVLEAVPGGGLVAWVTAVGARTVASTLALSAGQMGRCGDRVGKVLKVASRPRL